MNFDPNKNKHYTLNLYINNNEKYTVDTYADRLVAEAFLENIKRKNRIYHIDNNQGNNYYKNLIYVTDKERYKLKNNIITINDLQKQEYIPYITNKTNKAYHIWNGIYNRCYDDKTKKLYPHYQKATMCDSWKNDPQLFAEWWEFNYYDVFGESMQVDKDLLCRGNTEYAPDKCCILPQTLNVMLSNCKKHYNRGNPRGYKRRQRVDNGLPIGVRYDNDKNKYYAQIKINTALGDEMVSLNYCDKPEEAFEEYKKHKQAYILMMADKYKNYIPDKVYAALVNYEIEPY